MKHSKLKFILFLILGFTLSAVADNSLLYSQRMAQSQMARSGGLISWDYPNGLFVESVLKVYDMYGGSTYYNYALNYAKACVNTTTGKITAGYSFTAYTLDNINPGMFLMQIYETEKSIQYKTALDTLRKQISKQPRTNYSATGGFWHKSSYPHQMWLDGLYMGARFYAAYEKAFNNGAAYDDVVNQFVLIHSKTYDPAYQLNYHAWSALPTDANSFWANQTDPFKGCSNEFWARGLGWYAAALVDVLEVLPENYSRRQELVDILNQVTAGIKRWQDPVSGCWYQLLRYDNTLTSNGKANYIEASASSMFTYALLKAIRLGFISKTDYLPVATKAYQGLIDNFISEDSKGNLSLNRICKSAGLGPASNLTRDGSINYYLNGSDAGQIVSNDLKGVGPFIMASVEYEIYQNSITSNSVVSPDKIVEITKLKDSIVIRSNIKKQAKIELYNSLGKAMTSSNLNEKNELKISTINYIPGIYLLLVNNKFLEKIII